MIVRTGVVVITTDLLYELSAILFGPMYVWAAALISYILVVYLSVYYGFKLFLCEFKELCVLT